MTQTILVHITNINDAPTAKADSISYDEDAESVSIPLSALLGNDTDPDGDTLSFAGISSTTTVGTLETVGDPVTGLPIGSSRDNLKSAIASETHEYTNMYSGMAKTARDEGFDEIADWFETLAKAERSHANRFQKALDALVD